MIELIKKHNIIETALPRLFLERSDDKILAFERNGLFFVFNFHPAKSFTDYSLEVPPGEYILAMDTDEARFGGQKRLREGQHYFTKADRCGDEIHHRISLYLPCRTALVLRRESAKNNRTATRG